MTSRAVMRVFLIVAVGYAALALCARLLAARALYHPQMGSRAAVPGMIKISSKNGDDISVLHLPNATARFTIWFFHGNAEDLGDVAPFMQSLQAAGFAVFAFDYPGYGLSGGKPSERSIRDAAHVARAYLRCQLGVPAADTILFGRSLGGGPAVEMADEEAIGGLVLQSTFTSVFRVLTRLRILPFDYFENERKIARVKCPVLIMHGRNDEVIPFHHAQSLYAAAREPKFLLPIPGAMHNDFLAIAGRKFWDALRDFSAVCAKTSGSRP